MTAWAPVAAKFSVSALVFDYILTGPISVVSAGQYLAALLNEISGLLHQSYRITRKHILRRLRGAHHDLFLVGQRQGRP